MHQTHLSSFIHRVLFHSIHSFSVRAFICCTGMCFLCPCASVFVCMCSVNSLRSLSHSLFPLFPHFHRTNIFRYVGFFHSFCVCFWSVICPCIVGAHMVANVIFQMILWQVHTLSHSTKQTRMAMNSRAYTVLLPNFLSFPLILFHYITEKFHSELKGRSCNFRCALFSALPASQK